MTSCDCQVINLGAGFDTTYWLLRDQNLSPKIYVDVDFTEVTSRKCHIIKYVYVQGLCIILPFFSELRQHY